MARRDGRIERRGEQKWLVRWYLGQDPTTGRYRYKSTTVRGTKKDAERELRRVLRERDTGSYIESSKLTLAGYLERWLEDAAKRALRRRTFDDYKGLLEREVLYLHREKSTDERKPTKLASRQLESLRPLDFQAVYNGMEDRGLSRSIRMLHYVLRSAFSQAISWGLLRGNPTDGVKLPKQRKREKLALTPEQVADFRRAAAENRHALLFDFMLGTGMGPGEVLALRWRDLDLDASSATLHQTLTREGTRWVIAKGEAKREQRLRTVILPESLIAPLRAHRKAQAAAILGAGVNYLRDLDLLFADRVGAPLSPDNLRSRHFGPLCRKAGLPDGFRLYDLRHTTATLLLREGVTPKVVAERLGHDVQTLLRHYAHVLPGQQEEAAEKLDGLIFR